MKKLIGSFVLIIIGSSTVLAMTKAEEEATYQMLMSRRPPPVEAVETVTQERPAVRMDERNVVEKKEVVETVAYVPVSAVPATTGVSASEMSEKMAGDALKAPSSGTDRSKYHFHEVNAYVGAYHSVDTGSHGLWFMGEYIYWKKGQESPQNFGLGGTAKGDWGETKDGKYDWGSFAIGPNFDYWTELGLGENYLLAKFRPLYRWKKDGQSGFMPGGYLEFDHVVGLNDTFIAALDGQYFPQDSYASFSLLWDHRINNNFKVKGGIVFTDSFSGGNSFGIGPTISLRLYDRWVIGVSDNFFLGGGSTLGVYAGYEINSDMQQWYGNSKEKSVSLSKAGEKEIPMGSENQIADITLSDKTFAQEK